MDEFATLNGEQQEQIAHTFNNFNATIKGQELIAVIRDKLNLFEENKCPRLLSQITSWEQPKLNEITLEPSGVATSNEGLKHPPPTKSGSLIKYLSYHTVKIFFEKDWLVGKADMEIYLIFVRKRHNALFLLN